MPQRPKVSAEIKEATKATQWQIDRVILIGIFCLCLIGVGVVSIPSAYQTYMLSSDTDDWFSVNRFQIYDEAETGAQRFIIDRTINTTDPLTITILWTVKDAGTNEVLCERELFTTWEKTDVIDSVLRNVIRGCEDSPSWVGRQIKVQGQFSVTLHYGIRKEQTVTSNAFTYSGK